ncbi:COG5652 Predicted integral membrane protein [Flavobacteriaceae bacterium]
MVLKNIYLSAAIIWTCFIIFLCLASISNLPSVKVSNADKYVHFTFHFLFVILWFLYLNYKKSKNRFRLSIKLCLVSLLFGISIEFAQQTFTTTRKADIYDVFANTNGALIAVILLFIYSFIANKKQVNQ